MHFSVIMWLCIHIEIDPRYGEIIMVKIQPWQFLSIYGHITVYYGRNQFYNTGPWRYYCSEPWKITKYLQPYTNMKGLPAPRYKRQQSWFFCLCFVPKVMSKNQLWLCTWNQSSLTNFGFITLVLQSWMKPKFSQNFDQIWSNFGQIWSNFGQLWSTLYFKPKLNEDWPKFDRSWPKQIEVSIDSFVFT